MHTRSSSHLTLPFYSGDGGRDGQRLGSIGCVAAAADAAAADIHHGGGGAEADCFFRLNSMFGGGRGGRGRWHGGCRAGFSDGAKFGLYFHSLSA